MDANGTRFYLVPLAAEAPGLAWDAARRRLRLASSANAQPPADRAAARM